MERQAVEKSCQLHLDAPSVAGKGTGRDDQREFALVVKGTRWKKGKKGKKGTVFSGKVKEKKKVNTVSLKCSTG